MFERLRELIRRPKAPEASVQQIDQIQLPTYNRDVQLGDDVKAIFPEKWAQEAILQAWRTGKPAIGRRPVDSDKS